MQLLCKSILEVHVSILIRHANVLCAILYSTDLFNILFICIYMPCDLASNIDEFMYVLSNIEALRAKYIPSYVVCGGDLNTDMCRSNSVHTQTLGSFCHDNNMECVVSQGFTLSYTFESVLNNA